MESTKAKRGRKTKDHRCTWDGKPVDGLYRRPGGNVWRVRVTGQEFTEPDERLAIARFRTIEAGLKANTKVLLQTGTASDATEAFQKATGKKGKAYVFRIPKPGKGPIRIEETFDVEAYWGWLRHQIIVRPKWVAERVGIEQIGYLTDLKKPTPSQTLTELGTLYTGKAGLSSNEVSRSKLFWAEFIKAVGTDQVRELTHDHIIAYEKAITSKGYAPKSILHRHRKVRTILAYAIKRGRGIEDCRKVLDMTAMLEVKDAQPLDPQPIRVDDFWNIYDAAIEAEDTTFAALMLTSLNCAMYGGEVSALKWDDVDLKRGEIVTRRPKTGVSRVAVLWPDVVDALKKLERRHDYVFNTSRRSYVVASVIKAWRKHRTKAGLGEGVNFGMIRDAAFTIACRASSLDQARVLAGHRLPGQTDNYVRRDPQFVADACEAIRVEFHATRKAKRVTAKKK